MTLYFRYRRRASITHTHIVTGIQQKIRWVLLFFISFALTVRLGALKKEKGKPDHFRNKNRVEDLSCCSRRGGSWCTRKSYTRHTDTQFGWRRAKKSGTEFKKSTKKTNRRRKNGTLKGDRDTERRGRRGSCPARRGPFLPSSWRWRWPSTRPQTRSKVWRAAAQPGESGWPGPDSFWAWLLLGHLRFIDDLGRHVKGQPSLAILVGTLCPMSEEQVETDPVELILVIKDSTR